MCKPRKVLTFALGLLLLGCGAPEPRQRKIPLQVPHGYVDRLEIIRDGRRYRFGPFVGYYFRPDKSEWMLISSWKAPKDGGWLRGLHSFSENFGGANGNLVRKALYGNQWIQTDKSQWLELTQASFSHDPTGRADRLDRFMGVEDGQFFLSHGGFIPGFTRFGEKFSRPAVGKQPANLPEFARKLARQ